MITRRKILLPLLCVFLLSLCAVVISACSKEQLTEDDVIDMGYEIAVTYDYQGGLANGDGTVKIRVPKNAEIPRPGAENSGGLAAPTRTSYSIRTYCIAQTDADGNLLRDENGNLIPGEEWNFNGGKVTEDITICAVWWENYNMVLHYGDGYSETKTVDVARTEDGAPTAITATAARVTGYTFLGYYLDEAESEPVSFPATLAFTEEKPTIEVWGNSLTGTYQVIRTADDFTAFSFLSGTNIYLLADIDMNDAAKKVTFPTTYSGKFIGNNHTISNITLEQSPTGRQDGNFGLFKALNSGAEIRDVTFENVTVTVDLNNKMVSEYRVGLFAGIMREGAKIENVGISGILQYKLVAEYGGGVTVNGFIGEQLTGATVLNCEYGNITVTDAGDTGIASV